jgi:hypothetical protein
MVTEEAENLLAVIEEIYKQLQQDVKEEGNDPQLQELLALFGRVYNGTKDEKSKAFFSDIIEIMSFIQEEDYEED